MSANGVYRLSSSPLFRWISRRHSSSKLFVGGLSYDTHEPVLKDVFEQHGELIEVKVICDHKSGKSKGYGFVHFVSEDSAIKALAEMDGQVVDGRNIRIHYANKNKPQEYQGLAAKFRGHYKQNFCNSPCPFKSKGVGDGGVELHLNST